MNNFRNRITVDDSKFVFLESGTYPADYIGLNPALIYPSYFIDVMKPWIDQEKIVNSRYDNWTLGYNIDNYPIQEYWEFIPESLRDFGNKYATIPYGTCVSTFGRIYDYGTKTEIPVYKRKDGYLGVFNMMALHRIILYTFLPIDNFLDMTVDHRNLIVVDNCLWNLQWMSLHDNIQKAINYGNRTNPYFKKGMENIRATITDWEVELCCQALLSHKYSYTQIAKALGITVRQVKHIRDHDCHLDICDKYNMQENDFDYRHLIQNKDFIVPLLC